MTSITIMARPLLCFLGVTTGPRAKNYSTRKLNCKSRRSFPPNARIPFFSFSPKKGDLVAAGTINFNLSKPSPPEFFFPDKTLWYQPAIVSNNFFHANWDLPEHTFLTRRKLIEILASKGQLYGEGVKKKCRRSDSFTSINFRIGISSARAKQFKPGFRAFFGGAGGGGGLNTANPKRSLIFCLVVK